MSKLNYFGIQNFKIFQNPTSFDFSRINILTGKNNSGKSTLLRSLQLFRQAMSNNLFASINLIENQLNLGSFDIISKLGQKSKGIVFTVKSENYDGIFYKFHYTSEVKEFEGISRHNFKGKSIHAELIKKINDNLDNHGAFLYNLSIYLEDFELMKFQVTTSLNDVLEYYISEGVDCSSLVDIEVNLKRNQTGLYPYQLKFNEKNINKLIKEGRFLNIENLPKTYKFKADEFNNIVLHGTPSCTENFLGFENINKIVEYFFTIEEVSLGQVSMNDIIRGKPFPKKQEILAAFEVIKNRSNYLFNDKSSHPETFVLFNEQNLKIGNLNDYKVFGKLAVLMRDISQTVKDNFLGTEFVFLPAFRSSPERVYLHSNPNILNKILRDYDNEKSSYDEDFIKKWMKMFNIGHSFKIERDISFYRLKIQNEYGEFDLNDLGFGISQVFPIILSLSCGKNKMIFIEEPEAHLHPNLQSKMAELFIDSLKKKRHQIFLETHSEYLIRKFQFLISKADMDSEDLIIYYFDSNAQAKNSLRKITANRFGQLSENFGTGFFDEADNIAIDLLIQNQNAAN